MKALPWFSIIILTHFLVVQIQTGRTVDLEDLQGRKMLQRSTQTLQFLASTYSKRFQGGRAATEHFPNFRQTFHLIIAKYFHLFETLKTLHRQNRFETSRVVGRHTPKFGIPRFTSNHHPQPLSPAFSTIYSVFPRILIANLPFSDASPQPQGKIFFSPRMVIHQLRKSSFPQTTHPHNSKAGNISFNIGI
ncbi:hypothetical protein Cgig2_007713 [Carnegiea gigantea]|uniref:Uncharacterized protein n=1 Tax=Carnegiea gigantea TaxID=171969 RepID=A0A9Q1QE16_9CARY|nr:hypothetical protein Cgig2_007713 [Carnegiea gigantea]